MAFFKRADLAYSPLVTFIFTTFRPIGVLAFGGKSRMALSLRDEWRGRSDRRRLVLECDFTRFFEAPFADRATSLSSNSSPASVKFVMVLDPLLGVMDEHPWCKCSAGLKDSA